MDFAADTMKDESSVQKHDQGYRTSLSTRGRKSGKRRGNFEPPVNNKLLKVEMENVKTNSTILENGLHANNSEIKEEILQESEMVKNPISNWKNISPKAKNDGEQDDKNSENNETIKSCSLNLLSDNVVKSLDSIFFTDDANDNISFSSLQSEEKEKSVRKSQWEQQHISPNQKKNEIKMLEENNVDTYNLLEKEIGNDQTIINGSTEKEEHFLLSKTAISPLCERSEQNEMKELTDIDEKSALTKLHTIILDNENKKEDENYVTETKIIYPKEQEKCVNLECHADVKDFMDSENKMNTTIPHANLDNAENFKNECINILKNTKFQDIELVKETSNKISLFQQSSSPALIDELLNGIKQADAIVNMLSNGNDTENCTANGDITSIQFLKDITITSMNEKRNLQKNCNEGGNGLANCSDCKNECEDSNFDGTHKSPKHDQNTLVENSRVSDKIHESGSNLFQGEVSKQIIDPMDSMDKSLAPQEKKLTLFYMNALDYDQEILSNDGDGLKTNIETKDYEKHAQILSDSVNIDIGSLEMKRVEINMHDNNENALNESNSLPFSPTNTDQHLLRDKDELETSEKNDFQLQNLPNTNTENVITKKTINDVIHDQDCIKSLCNDQNQRGSDENIIHCNPADKENKFSVSCDTQQSEVLTTETAYIIKEVSSTVSFAENSNSDCIYNKISLHDNATEEKSEKVDDCIKKKCLKIPEMSLLVTATDYFKVGKVKNTEILNETENNSAMESMDNSCISTGQSDNKENLKENDTTCLDAEDIFDMDDDFDLTASQLSMIEVDERNHINTLKQEKKNSSEETTKCVNTHFNSDSVTVDIMDQLCYIRESVESIKDLLSMLLKEK